MDIYARSFGHICQSQPCKFYIISKITLSGVQTVNHRIGSRCLNHHTIYDENLVIDINCISEHIYYIYGVRSDYIRLYSRLDLGFFFLGQKIASGAICALGPSALGHRQLPSAIFYLEKKCLALGAISSYIALLDPIYTLHIYIYIYIDISRKKRKNEKSGSF